MTTKDDVIKQAEARTARLEKQSKPKETSLKPELEALVAKAKEAEAQKLDTLKRRAESPEGVNVRMHAANDPVTEFTERHVPPGYTGYTTTPDQISAAVARGYQPAIHPVTKDHVRVGDDLGFIRRADITESELADISARSDARVAAMDEQLSDDVKARAKAEGVEITEEVEVS